MIKRILLGVVAVLLAAGLDWKLPYAQGFNSSGSTVTIYSRTTSLTAAQLRALDTAVSLVPAAGSGKLVVVQAIAARYAFVTQPYVSIASPGLTTYVRYAGLVSTADQILPDLLGNWTGNILQQTSTKAGIYQAGTGANSTSGLNSAIGDNSATLAGLGVELISASGSLALGPIVSTTKGSGGTGYAATDTFTVDSSSLVSSGDATGVVDTVDGSGVVLTYHLTGNGAAYPIANGLATSTNHAGTGLTINVTNVTQGDGTLKITVNYSIADVS